MPKKKLIGNNIKDYRTKFKKTQEEIATFLEVTREEISYFENGQRVIPLDKLLKLSDFFGVELDEFMTTEPKCVHLGQLASEAMALQNAYRIDELPVLDDDGRPVGVIDVQDVLDVKTLRNE